MPFSLENVYDLMRREYVILTVLHPKQGSFHVFLMEMKTTEQQSDSVLVLRWSSYSSAIWNQVFICCDNLQWDKVILKRRKLPKNLRNYFPLGMTMCVANVLHNKRCDYVDHVNLVNRVRYRLSTRFYQDIRYTNLFFFLHNTPLSLLLLSVYQIDTYFDTTKFQIDKRIK